MQMSKRAQDRKPHVPLIARNARKAINKLSFKKREFVKARFEGLNAQAASGVAGVSPQRGRAYERSRDVQAAYRELISNTLPAEQIAELIKGGCFATMPFFTSKGKREDIPDWRARKPYIEMAREDGGYVEKKTDATGTIISVTVQHVGGRSEVKLGGSEPVIEDSNTPILPSETESAENC
jgi:hypothetical protein